jgi:integrase
MPRRTDLVLATPQPLEQLGVARGSEHHRGPIFRGVDRHGRVACEGLSDRTVARIVQGTGEKAGLDPKAFAGHSLRAGFATTAAKKGKSLDAIMRQTLHKSEEVARGYIRHAKLFDDNAAVGLG